MMLDKLTVEDFRPYLKQSFHVHYNDADFFEVQLIDVKDLGNVFGDEEDDLEDDAIVPLRKHPFSLMFRSPNAHEYLPQQIYSVTHEQMGTLEIFLVPVGPDRKGMRYQAIFT